MSKNMTSTVVLKDMMTRALPARREQQQWPVAAAIDRPSWSSSGRNRKGLARASCVRVRGIWSSREFQLALFATWHSLYKFKIQTHEQDGEDSGVVLAVVVDGLLKQRLCKDAVIEEIMLE